MKGAEFMGKSYLSEEDIKLRYITPAITDAGWDKKQLRLEYAFTAGRIILRGNFTARGKQKRADYVLFYKSNFPLAIVEAKDNNHPVFAVFGDGNYRLQPIYVDDLAKLAVEQGQGTDNRIIDAIGPETFTYRELVEIIAKVIGKKRPIISVPVGLGYYLGWMIGKFTRSPF